MRIVQFPPRHADLAVTEGRRAGLIIPFAWNPRRLADRRGHPGVEANVGELLPEIGVGHVAVAAVRFRLGHGYVVKRAAIETCDHVGDVEVVPRPNTDLQIEAHIVGQPKSAAIASGEMATSSKYAESASSRRSSSGSTIGVVRGVDGVICR